MELIHYVHRKNHAMPVITAHMIDFYELTIVLRGTIEYTVNGEALQLGSGDVIFLTPGTTRTRKAFADCDYISFNYSLDEGEEEILLPTCMRTSVTHEIALLLNACRSIHAQLLPDSDRILLILRCILLQLQVNITRDAVSPIVYQIKKYIHANLDKNLTIESIAKQLNYSKSYISAIFKDEMGISLISYAINEKINEAKVLIANDVPLRQVAQSLGFDDYNYFSRMFKKRVQYTPIQYKHLLAGR